MCGLAGFLSTRPLTPDDTQGHLRRMAGALRHRGPDDSGLWSDANAGIALCHRRLAVVDLSPSGHQPMISVNGRFVLTYNGEIYNHRELRKELIVHGHVLRGTSDTEVLLAAIECWGLGAAIERSVGMFALAVWDRFHRSLHLVRDRFGEKPLYFGVCGDTLLFGSELKALRQHPRWMEEIDRDALALMMQHDYVPAPFSIFKNIRKVMPGCVVAASATDAGFDVAESRYWQPQRFFDAHYRNPELTPVEAVELVDAALSRSIARQMHADVAVGAFLSGGTDSSLVVAMMQKAASRPIKTFCIGFSESEFDEAPFARAVAAHLGTEHVELIVTPRECLQTLPLLPHVYDEPFADQAQIPTYLLCELTRRAVTVSLSGDGGDELFGGYGRYALALSRWRTINRVPIALRARCSALFDALPASTLRLMAAPASLIWNRYGRDGLADRLREHSHKLRARTLRDFYSADFRRWPVDSGLVIGVQPGLTGGSGVADLQGADGLKQMMYMDTCGYLPDDILVKLDRAAMAVSLETRTPMLDSAVAQAAWRIPSSILRHDGRGKWVLRELLRRHIPGELVDRPKHGFAVPLKSWLRRDLRPWASDLLAADRLRRDGYLNAELVQRRWRQHLDGNANWTQHLWNVLTFQAWLADWRTRHAEDLRQVNVGG